MSEVDIKNGVIVTDKIGKYGNVIQDGDLLKRSYFDESDGKMYTETLQNVEEHLAFNKAMRDAAPEHGKYKKKFTMISSIPIAFVLKMQNGQCCPNGKTYDLMSPDPDEYSRAKMHLQSCHKTFLTITGKPFSKKRMKWQ